MNKFELALSRFVAFCELKANRFWTSSEHHIEHRTSISVKKGRKYAKVIRSNGGSSRSVFCFVNMKTGEVLKAASWKAPAKHARGSIYAAETSGYGITEHGACYIS